MKNDDRETAWGEFAALIGAAAAAMIWYCERLQFVPTQSKTFLVTLLAVFFGSGVLFFIVFRLIRKGIERIQPGEWLPIILISLVVSIIVMVWFPVPETGIYPAHTLEIRVLPDEEGTVKPVTLTWMHHEYGDIPLSDVQCTGNCSLDENGPSLTDQDAEIKWSGKTGNLVTIEFKSGRDQGIAEITWDGISNAAALNNDEFTRLSFDFALAPSNGLPEFIAVWAAAFLISLAGTIGAVKLFPEWSPKKFGTGAFLCFVLFRAATFLTVKEPLYFIDSESYLGMSRMPVLDILRGTQYCHQQYWYCISRPAFIPLVYKLCGQNPTAITIIQLVISIFSWFFFTDRVSLLCQKINHKKAIIMMTLGLGCIPNVTRWDQMIMSESLSISAALLLMGCCFWFTAADKGKKWKPVPAVFLFISAVLYAGSRDSAVWTVILIIIILLCISRLRDNKKVIFILCAGLSAFCWLMISSTGGRWQYPFENVLFNRILRDPQGEKFFISAGMPTPSRIGELYGVEHMMGSELFNSDEMAPLREWIAENGLQTYIRYMLQTPFETLRMTWYEGFEKEAFEQTDYIFAPPGFMRLLPEPIIKLFSCNLPGILILGFGLAGILTAFHVSKGERYSFPVLFVLSAYILCTGVFIADEYELARHSMVILIMMKASAWPLIFMLMEDKIHSSVRQRAVFDGR